MQMEPALTEVSESIELDLNRQMEQHAGPFHLPGTSEVRLFTARALK